MGDAGRVPAEAVRTKDAGPGAKAFGYIHKPRFATRRQCDGEVHAEGGRWRCRKCSATRKGEHAGHREMRESRFWAVAYSHDGERHCVSSKSREWAVANKLRKKIFSEIWQGRLPSVERKELPLREVLDLVVGHYKREKLRSLKRVELSIRHILACPKLEKGNVLARRATETVIKDEYVPYRQAMGAANATINRELAVLRQGFRIGTGRLDEDGRPLLERMPRVTLLKENPPRQGLFEDHQFEAVHRALLAGDARSSPEDLADLAVFYFNTGWRSSEPTSLTWAQVNWFRKTITLDRADTKSGEPWELPFGSMPEIEELLRKRRRRTDRLEALSGRRVEWVFHRGGGRIRSFRRAWKSACKRAGVPERTPHDFRRTAASNLIDAGADAIDTCDIVGWKSLAMLKRYRIKSVRSREQAMAKLHDLHHRRREAAAAAESIEKRRGGG
jgi:integrase